METVQRAKRVGGSIMVRIPKEIVEVENIHEDELVKVKIEKVRKDWFGAFPDLKPYNKEEDRARSKYE